MTYTIDPVNDGSGLSTFGFPALDGGRVTLEQDTGLTIKGDSIITIEPIPYYYGCRQPDQSYLITDQLNVMNLLLLIILVLVFVNLGVNVWKR